MPWTAVTPTKAQSVLMTMDAVRKRPMAAGAITITPQVTYQDHTMGPKQGEHQQGETQTADNAVPR